MALANLPPYPTVVLLGDSITQQGVLPYGWATGLANLYIRRLDIINRGFSGYNTSHIRRILPSILPPSIFPTLKLITIFLGANDCTVPGHIQNVPQDEFEANLTAMVEYVRKQKQQAHINDGNGSGSISSTKHENNGTMTRILLITPPPICEYKTQIHDHEVGSKDVQRLSPRTAEYASIVRALATTLDANNNNDIACCDLWTAFMAYATHDTSINTNTTIPTSSCIAADQITHMVGEKALEQSMKLDELLRDGLHLSEMGEKMVLDCVLQTIVAKWPEMDPMEMPFLYDSWQVAKRFGQ